jgi:hypothetical protein
MSNRASQYWVIPPKANGEFVADMEIVLNTYAEPYDSKHPVICMDEKPMQLLKETRPPIPETKEHPRRVDYEYERAGTASIFLFCEPLIGWRQVTVREQRTKVDWAEEVAQLLNGRYATAEKIILVCDNLNTHTAGAFYEAFEASVAHALVSRIEFRYTPKHGSWLNIAECELSVLTRQCIGHKRFGSIDELRSETLAWSNATNDNQKPVDWQFPVNEARIKLKSLYPKI